MVDRYTKSLLTVIAACLVWIVARDVTLVRPAHADADLSTIEHDLHGIWSGICLNGKIC